MVVLCKKLFFFVFFGQKIFLSVSGWVMSWIWVCSRRKWSNFVGNWLVFPLGGRLQSWGETVLWIGGRSNLQFWTLSETILKINFAFKRWRVHCLCPSSLVSNPKWRLGDKSTDLKRRLNRDSTALFHFWGQEIYRVHLGETTFLWDFSL